MSAVYAVMFMKAMSCRMILFALCASMGRRILSLLVDLDEMYLIYKKTVSFGETVFYRTLLIQMGI